MKIFALGIALFAFTNGFASMPATFRIASELFIDGKSVSSPKILTESGTTAVVTEKNDDSVLNFEVTANEFKNQNISDGILMNFDIHYVRDGRMITATPQVITKPGSEATITIGKNDSREVVTLKILATRE